MATNLDYIHRNKIERVFLKEIFTKLFNKENYDVNYYLTDEEGYDEYDGGACFFDKHTGSVINRHIYEIKIRDKHYPDLLLEQRKYNKLVKKAEYLDAQIKYISVTPLGTYIWNITKHDNYCWVKEQHNKSTTELYKGKISKKVTYLSTDLAKYTSNIRTNDYDKLYKEQEFKQEIKIHKQNKCLFEWLLNNND